MLRWLNPIFWVRAFSHFVWCWVVSLPVPMLAGALPAIIGLAIVVAVTVLTYTSDPQWRRGFVMTQLSEAKKVGSNGEVALLAKRLLRETPDDLDLQYEAALAAVSGTEEEKTKGLAQIEQLAKGERHGRAAFWLLEKNFMPLDWQNWDEAKRGEFGTLIQIAADAQPENQTVSSIYADYLLMTGSAEKALGPISRLVSTQPARALQGALILRQTGRESQAATMARDALDRMAQRGGEEPENVELALMRAQFALFLKQYEEAIQYLNRTAKLSEDARLRSGIAECLVLWSRDQGMITNPTERFARQLSLLNKAVEVAPNHPLVISDLMAVVLQCADETDPKVAQLRDILVQGIAPELAHFIRGTAAMIRGDVDEAMLHLELAEKTLPAVPAVLNNLAVALTAKEDADLDRALLLVDTALKQIPTQPYFHETRAQILLKQKRHRDAVVSFEKALPAKELREQVHYGLRDAYVALDQKELAEQHERLADAIKKARTPEEAPKDVKVDFSTKKNSPQ